VVQGVRDLDQLVTAAGLVVQAVMGLTLLIPAGLLARAAARAAVAAMVAQAVEAAAWGFLV
jgi:hypothetical protein